MENAVILQMKGISKAFPGVQALLDVQLELREGEVLALMGENGAGKSTLMKILTGIYHRDAGEVIFQGEALELKSIRDAQAKGIGIIHQELNMMLDLTVAQNIFIGREPRKGLFIDDKKMNDEARQMLLDIGMDIDPREKLGNLTVGRQQMVEIAKALSFNSKILILDEPTSALTSTEIDNLFRVMEQLRQQGVGMIYISHRMDEIERISDRITVMRDGQYVDTVDTAKTSRDELIHMMVGRTVFVDPKTESSCPADAPVVLEVRNLNAGPMVEDISFTVREGEIVCFSGLMGAGRTETARALFGADPKTSGQIFIDGKEVRINSPEDAVKAGICYLSEDRKRFGIATGLSVAYNIALPNYDQYANGVFTLDEKIASDSKAYVEQLNIKTPSVNQLVRNLSGGNQQKVVIAKWLARNSKIMIFDEPTRGIDVGAKSEIYQLIQQLAHEGKAVIVISSELAEVQRLADRIIVMCEGRITGETEIGSTQNHIMTLATQRRTMDQAN